MDDHQIIDPNPASSSKGSDQAAPGIDAHDVKAINRGETRELYKSREPIYPKRVRGTYRRVKAVAMTLMFAIYYGLPWLRWDRGEGAPDQAVLVDFPGRRFYFFFIEIWPQEIYYITGLLILAAIGLFLVTSLFGRIWCGFACPQTVWTDLFLAVERRVEGDRNKRIKLARAPWTLSKISKKIVKHSIWILIALCTGGAWVLYFHDAPTLLREILVGQAPLTAYVFIALLTFMTYLLGGFAREQVCIYMCPWPRIQGAMLDEDTLMVSYERDRGEPRGPHKKGETWEGRGHCVDCKQCVVVCPMGIDIRDGAQLECIGCALCVDACNGIMKKLDLEPNLIGFDTDKNIARRTRGEPTSFHIFRPRTFAYVGILIAVAGVMLYGLLNRSVLELNIQRDRNPLFVTLSDGSIRNGYTVKILNKRQGERVFRLDVASSVPMTTKILGFDEADGIPDIDVPQDKLRSLRVFLTKQAGSDTKSSIPVTFTITDIEDGTTADYDAVFIGGRP